MALISWYLCHVLRRRHNAPGFLVKNAIFLQIARRWQEDRVLGAKKERARQEKVDGNCFKTATTIAAVFVDVCLY